MLLKHAIETLPCCRERNKILKPKKKPLETRPTCPVRDIFKPKKSLLKRALLALLGTFFETCFGNLGIVIKSIPTCPVSTGTAGRPGETKKVHTHGINRAG